MSRLLRAAKTGGLPIRKIFASIKLKLPKVTAQETTSVAKVSTPLSPGPRYRVMMTLVANFRAKSSAFVPNTCVIGLKRNFQARQLIAEAVGREKSEE